MLAYEGNMMVRGEGEDVWYHVKVNALPIGNIGNNCQCHYRKPQPISD